MPRAEPLETSESDLPQELLNQLSVACGAVPSLRVACVGWMRRGDTDRSGLDPRIEPELYLWYGPHLPPPEVRSFGARSLEARFIDTPDLIGAGLPDIDMSCSHDVAPDADIEQRWLRVF